VIVAAAVLAIPLARFVEISACRSPPAARARSAPPIDCAIESAYRDRYCSTGRKRGS